MTNPIQQVVEKVVFRSLRGRKTAHSAARQSQIDVGGGCFEIAKARKADLAMTIKAFFNSVVDDLHLCS